MLCRCASTVVLRDIRLVNYKSDNHKCFLMEYVLHIFVARDHMQLQHSTLPIARTNRHNRPFSLYLNNAGLSCRRAAAIDDTVVM